MSENLLSLLKKWNLGGFLADAGRMDNSSNVLMTKSSEFFLDFALFGYFSGPVVVLSFFGPGDDDLYSGFGKEDVAPALATHDLEYDPAFQVLKAFQNVKRHHEWVCWDSQDKGWKRGRLVKCPLNFAQGSKNLMISENIFKSICLSFLSTQVPVLTMLFGKLAVINSKIWNK